MPYDGIQVNLSAQWTQHLDGELDVFPFIARQFPKGKINTLTPHYVQHYWPKVGDHVGQEKTRKRSGYQVVHSTLRCVPPPHTGGLDIYPTLTPELIPNKRLQHYWMDGNLLISFHYRQKRREVARFFVPHHHQLKGGMGRIKTLNLELQKTQSASTFFNTPQGQQALNYANLMAQTILANSARCVEVECEVPLEAAIDISLDHSVRLSSELIPGGSLVGKVVAYKIIKTFESEVCWFRLSVSAGIGTGQWAQLAPLNLVETEKPLEDYVAEDFVKSVSVQWDGERQTQYLQTQDLKDEDQLQTCLTERGTTITLSLSDLRTQDVITKNLDLVTISPFQAPQHIRLRNPHETF